jgi:hypothetical protein
MLEQNNGQATPQENLVKGSFADIAIVLTHQRLPLNLHYAAHWHQARDYLTNELREGISTMYTRLGVFMLC